MARFRDRERAMRSRAGPSGVMIIGVTIAGPGLSLMAPWLRLYF